MVFWDEFEAKHGNRLEKEFEKMEVEYQNMILNSIENLAKDSVRRTLKYRTGNIISKMYAMIRKLNLSEEYLNQCIEECRNCST